MSAVPVASHLVVGEELPAPIAPLLTMIGFASAIAALVAFRTATIAAAPQPPPAPIAVPVAAPLPVPIPVATTAPAPPAPCVRKIAFANAAAALDREATDEVRVLGAWLAQHPDVSAVLDGHADSRGSERANLKLSHQRAEAVAAALQSAGVQRQRLTVRGFGAFSPVEEERDDAAINRRVVIHIILHQTSDACPSSAAEEGKTP